jgi:hypothetical protein
MIDSRFILHDIFYDIPVNFSCTYPLLYTSGMCDVTCIVVYNSYLRSKCFLPALYNDINCLWMERFVSYWLKFTRVCHCLKQFTMHNPTSHFSQKYSVIRVFLFWEHTRHLRCFPLEGQCCECFTSSRLSWDAVGLGLPLEVPLAVTFFSCEWIINSRTSISRKCLCVILPPHDLCIRNALRVVMSVRWKNNFLVHFHVLRAIP